MVGINNNNNIFTSAAGASNEIWKILKKEEKKGKSKIFQAIQEFHLAHEEVKKELAKTLTEETGMNVKADSDLVDNMVFSLSMNKIFENREGQEFLAPDLKAALQKFDSESPQAKEAVANKLSEGSKKKVPSNDKLIGRDIDEISLRTIDNPELIS